MSDSTDYTFVCPKYAESMLVNDSMRDAPLENSCVVCSTALTADAFLAT